MTSSHLLLNFTVDQLKKCKGVEILSVLKNKLLISCNHHSEFYIYDDKGNLLSIINNSSIGELLDATWTPHGNIVYTTHTDTTVMVISESGKFISKHKQMERPWYFSVSSDDVIYLVDAKAGVYRSTDNGLSWSLLFKSTSEWGCLEVIKVTTNYGDDFWTVKKSYANNFFRVYKRIPNGSATWRDINYPTTVSKPIDLSGSRLSYDGAMNIFVSAKYEKAVQVLSVNGQYYRQLLSSHHIKSLPFRLAVVKECQLMFVGQELGVVLVFKMKYGDGGD